MQKRISIITLIVVVVLCCLATFMTTFLVLHNEKEADIVDEYVSTDPTETDIPQTGADKVEQTPAQNQTQTNNTTNSTNLSPFMSKVVEKLSIVDEYFRNFYIGDLNDEELIDGIISGYVAGTGDEYGAYYNTENFAAFMSDLNAELVGVGINVIYNTEYGLIEVLSVQPESPALEAGVQPGDLIYTVGDEKKLVSELGYYPAINELRGEVGSIAVFTVLRGDNYTEEVEFRIPRAKIKEITVMSHVYALDETVAVIKITGFDSGTPKQFKEKLAELVAGGCDKLIVDLRYNPGGELESICEILDYILPDGGPIIHVVDGDGNEVEVRYTKDGHELKMPMAVLVNGSTASAAELFTAAVKDYQKATIVGTKTYGKGCMQTTIPLYSNWVMGTIYDGSAVSITYRMYDPPFSDNYHGVGIEPHIVVELDEALEGKNIYKITDEEDNQLRAAVASFYDN